MTEQAHGRDRPIRMHHPNGDVTDYGEAVRPAAARGGAVQRWAPSVALMIFAGALLALMSMGIRNILPLWQTPMLQDMGWSSLEFSIAIATQNLLWGLFSPVFGALADKFGSEKTLAFGAMLQAAGLWVMSAATDPATFLRSAGLLIGSAQSAAGRGTLLGGGRSGGA